MAEAPSVAVLIPTRESVPVEFLRSCLSLQLPPGALWLTTRKIPLDAARNQLARDALESGAEWFLWLDSDMVFPPETFRRLNSHGRPFVAAPYALRKKDAPCSALGWDPADLTADSVGFGCVLTHRSLFERVSAPWFDFTKGRDPENGVGEDVFFCEIVRDATGIRPFVDGALRVGHVLSGEVYILEG